MRTSSVSYGTSVRGVTASAVSYAADTLLRAGNRPSVEKIRVKLGGGSPNTINPLLDAWWKTLSARLDSGPAALHRLPESVAHVAEALWMQALDEGRSRARQDLHRTERTLTEQQQTFEVRSHVLTLREGELDSRLKDREKTIDVLSLQLRELNLTLRKERATRESLTRRLTTLENQLLARTPAHRNTRTRQPSIDPRSTQTAKERRQPRKNSISKGRGTEKKIRSKRTASGDRKR